MTARRKAAQGRSGGGAAGRPGSPGPQRKEQEAKPPTAIKKPEKHVVIKAGSLNLVMNDANVEQQLNAGIFMGPSEQLEQEFPAEGGSMPPACGPVRILQLDEATPSARSTTVDMISNAPSASDMAPGVLDLEPADLFPSCGTGEAEASQMPLATSLADTPGRESICLEDRFIIENKTVNEEDRFIIENKTVNEEAAVSPEAMLVSGERPVDLSVPGTPRWSLVAPQAQGLPALPVLPSPSTRPRPSPEAASDREVNDKEAKDQIVLLQGYLQDLVSDLNQTNEQIERVSAEIPPELNIQINASGSGTNLESAPQGVSPTSTAEGLADALLLGSQEDQSNMPLGQASAAEETLHEIAQTDAPVTPEVPTSRKVVSTTGSCHTMTPLPQVNSLQPPLERSPEPVHRSVESRQASCSEQGQEEEDTDAKHTDDNVSGCASVSTNNISNGVTYPHRGEMSDDHQEMLKKTQDASKAVAFQINNDESNCKHVDLIEHNLRTETLPINVAQCRGAKLDSNAGPTHPESFSNRWVRVIPSPVEPVAAHSMRVGRPRSPRNLSPQSRTATAPATPRAVSPHACVPSRCMTPSFPNMSSMSGTHQYSPVHSRPTSPAPPHLQLRPVQRWEAQPHCVGTRPNSGHHVLLGPCAPAPVTPIHAMSSAQTNMQVGQHPVAHASRWVPVAPPVTACAAVSAMNSFGSSCSSQIHACQAQGAIPVPQEPIQRHPVMRNTVPASASTGGSGTYTPRAPGSGSLTPRAPSMRLSRPDPPFNPLPPSVGSFITPGSGRREPCAHHAFHLSGAATPPMASTMSSRVSGSTRTLRPEE